MGTYSSLPIKWITNYADSYQYYGQVNGFVSMTGIRSFSRKYTYPTTKVFFDLHAYNPISQVFPYTQVGGFPKDCLGVTFSCLKMHVTLDSQPDYFQSASSFNHQQFQ